ncbi:MAG: histidine ammonia-lyase [Actinomycetota bacterium]
MVVLGPWPLSVPEVVAVARDHEPVEVSPEVEPAMAGAGQAVSEAVAGGRTFYGVTTGFGALAATRVAPEQAARVQYALVQSHAAGMGRDIDGEVVRAMQLLKARTLAAGRSGVRPALVQAIADLLNAGVTPAVPEMGSLGASGDLAPLAHAALVLMGSGWVTDGRGGRADAGPALAAAGLAPVTLGPKEGLALINGTEGMLAHLCLALADLDVLLPTLDVTCALSVEALRATDAPFAEKAHELRPHPGQRASAANLRALLAGSPVVASHRNLDHAVQDAYSLRCAPQVHGACRDVVAWARSVVDVELGSVTDNPVVLDDGTVMSTGNFHGQPLAFAADFLAIALADVASIAERRVDRLMDPARSDGLPPFLAPEAGVNSGFMLAHYTAAALVNRLRGHASPSSCDSVPTSAGQEDHVSMGWNGCLSLRLAVADAMRVAAVELVCAAEAVELRGIPPARATGAALAALRRRVPRMDADRFLAPDLAAAEDLVRSGALLRAVPVDLR